MPDKIPFDYLGAKKAGYSDDEIADFLKEKFSFDFDLKGAKSAGYSDAEIAGFISSYEVKKNQSFNVNELAPGFSGKEELRKKAAEERKSKPSEGTVRLNAQSIKQLDRQKNDALVGDLQLQAKPEEKLTGYQFSDDEDPLRVEQRKVPLTLPGKIADEALQKKIDSGMATAEDLKAYQRYLRLQPPTEEKKTQQQALQQFERSVRAVKTNFNELPQKEVQQYLNNLVQKRKPGADVAGMATEDIRGILSDNKTALVATEVFDKNRRFAEIMQTSKSLDEAAIKHLQFADKDTYLKMKGTGEVTPALQGYALHNFLSDETVQKWASKGEGAQQAYNQAFQKMFTDYKPYGKKLIGQVLHDERQRRGDDSYLLTILDDTKDPNKVTYNDRLFQEMVAQGKLPKEAEALYREMRGSLNEYIPTTDLTNALFRGLEHGIGNVIGFGADMAGIETDKAEKLDKELRTVQPNAKGANQIINFTGEFTGEMVPLMLLTRGIGSLGVGQKTASAIATGIFFEHPNRERAQELYPNDPGAQNLYTLLSTAVDIGVGSLYNRSKPLEGLIGETKKGFHEAIKGLRSGALTEAAYRESVEGTFNGFLKKAKDFGVDVLKHNTEQAAHMAGFTAAHNLIDTALGKDEFRPTDAVESFKHAFLSGGILSAMAARGTARSQRVAARQLSDLVMNAEATRDLIERDTRMSSEQKQELLQNLSTAFDIKTEMELDPELSSLTEKQKAKFLLHEVSQKVLSEQLKNTQSESIKEKLKSQIELSKEVNRNILAKRDIEPFATDVREENSGTGRPANKPVSKNEAEVKPEVEERVSDHPSETGQPVSETRTPVLNDNTIRPAENAEALQPEATPENQGGSVPDMAPRQPGIREPYTTQNGKYTITYEGGKRVIKDAEGNVPSERTARKYLKEHAETLNYNEGRTLEEKVAAKEVEVPEFASEKEAALFVAEHSENPAEIAEVFLQTPKEPVASSAKEHHIAESGLLGNVKPSSYYEWGDRNNSNASKAKAYMGNESTGTPLDKIAHELSRDGMEITEADLVVFMDKYPSGAYQALKVGETDAHHTARSRFEELTGVPLTEEIALRAAEQKFTAEELRKAEEVLGRELETEPLPAEELLKWMEETKEIEAEFEKENNLEEYERSNIEEAHSGRPETEGGVREIKPEAERNLSEERLQETAAENRVEEPAGIEAGTEISNAVANRPQKEMVQQAGNPIVDHLKKLFTSNRGMPDNWMALHDEAIGSRQFAARTMRRAISNLKQAMKADKFTDSKQIADALSQPLNDPANTAYQTLPSKTKAAVSDMRTIVDGYSESLVVNNLVTPSQAATIQQNIGQYLNRAYKLYTDKKWKDKVPKQVVDDALNFLTQQRLNNLKADPKNAHTPDAELLNRALKLAEQDVQDILTLKDTPAGQRYTEQISKDLSTLKKRQDIPEPIRRLMGEYTDPITTFAITVSKLATLHSQAELLVKLRDNFKGKLFFEKDEIRPEGFNYEVASDGSQTWNPLSGLYTSKQVIEAIQEQAPNIENWLKIYRKAFGMVKKFKTVYSLPTQTVNFFSNPMIAMANGHFKINEIGKSWKFYKDELFGGAKSQDEFIETAIKHNVIGQSVNLRMIRDMLRNDKADEFQLEEFLKPKSSIAPLEWIKSADKFAQRAYGASDSFWKMYGFMNELANWSDVMYGKKYRDLTPEEKKKVNEVAGERVKNTYPTYDRALPGLLWAGKNIPFIGNFMVYQAEVLRTVKNNFAYAIQDLKSADPKVKALGAKRMAGIIAYTGLKTAINYFVGVVAGNAASSLWASVYGDEEEKGKRQSLDTFLPEYLETHNLLVDNKGDGQYVVNDLDRLDPYNILWQAANGGFLKEKGGAQRIVSELAEPFIQPDMIIKAAGEIRANKDLNGFPIYNPADDEWKQNFDKLAYIYRIIEPTTVKYFQRVKESDDKSKEAVMSLFGARGYTVDVGKAFKNKLREAEGKLGLNQQFAYFNKEQATQYRANAKALITKLHDYYQDALKLGVPAEKMDEILNKAFYSLQKKKGAYIDAIRTGKIGDEALEDLYPAD